MRSVASTPCLRKRRGRGDRPTARLLWSNAPTTTLLHLPQRPIALDACLANGRPHGRSRAT
eukprot:6339233-Lingulodinium_polyedra.AAC.1